MNINAPEYDDEKMMHDLLYSQKQITENYNNITNECTKPQIRDIFINLLNEEHQIQSDIVDEMTKRSWLSSTSAEQQRVQQVKQKYTNMQQEN